MTRSVQTHSEPVLAGEGASTGSTQMGDVQTGRVQTGGTIGAFDLLHVGHLRFLQQARQSCDWLKVAVGEDRLLLRSKKLRVSMPDRERMELLAGLSCVDEVVLFDIGMDNTEATANWVKAWGIDVLFVSEDWRQSPRMQALEPALAARGIKCQWIAYTRGVSSTAIRQRVAQNIERRQLENS